MEGMLFSIHYWVSKIIYTMSYPLYGTWNWLHRKSFLWLFRHLGDGLPESEKLVIDEYWGVYDAKYIKIYEEKKAKKRSGKVGC